ncbi:MAG: type II toxin-antitoxin system HicA family toxin [Rhizobiaceae bacterium]|nr:type II toxin-antitoxin system HicA family toxin [Rhizobiaceae bacterium]
MTRDTLLRELRKLARKQGVRFDVEESRGKGSHYRVHYGDRFTTVKSGELKPGYVKLIRQQLGID